MVTGVQSLALTSLVVLATLFGEHRGECPQQMEPLNKTMLRLPMNHSMSWHQVLQRDFLHLTLEDRALCGDLPVPLGLNKQGPREPVVWPRSDYLEESERVSGTYVSRMLADDAPTVASVRVGSLHLAAGQWRLVDNDTLFSCAICQRGWVDWFWRLEESPPDRPAPFNSAYTFIVAPLGNDSIGVDEAIRLAERLLQENLTSPQARIRIERLDSLNDGDNGTLLRLQSSSWWVHPDAVLNALNGSYSVSSWQDMDRCPGLNTSWRATPSGEVRSVRLRDFHLATRRCSWRRRPDGDRDAFWDDAVLHWINRGEECRSRSVSSFVQRLDAFNRSYNENPIASLVTLTADAAGLFLPKDKEFASRANVSRAIVTALSILLKATTINTSTACQGSACAMLVDSHGPDTLLISHQDALPTFLNSNELPTTNLTTLMSVQLPRTLMTHGRVAMHVVHSNRSSLLRLLEYSYSNYSMLAHVVSTWPLNRSSTDRTHLAVAFRVNKAGYPHRVRSLAVWILGDSEASSQPCPWVDTEGTIETYLCNTWVHGPHDYTTAMFLVGSGDVLAPRESTLHSVLLGYSTIPISTGVLRKVVRYTNHYVARIGQNGFKFRRPGVQVLNPWQDILAAVLLTDPVFTASQDHVKVLVSDLTVNDPVVGFSIDSVGAMQTVTASSRSEVSVESEVDLVMGVGVQRHCRQMAILAVTEVARFAPSGSLDAYVKKLMVVHVAVTSQGSGNLFLEIQLQSGKKISENLDDGVRTKFQVATWSDATNGWRMSSCTKLRSTRATKPVVRCELESYHGILVGRYLVFEPVGLAEACGMPLMIVLIAAGLLSGVSLVSIAGTAALLPAWRQDLGHKILLQMTLALSFNLALGFTSSFVSVDTASVACVPVGALRHFSYLAMFAWMLVMSGLQLRRILSVLGARSTSNLLLKVSVFAWGVPTVAVVLLVSLKTETYQWDSADRGFCYPEGTAFALSVQAPAATVLALNALIFVVILARLYSFLGWGETEDLRRHLNEWTVQLRRLRAVFFTFFLFGITWLFHLLAEQGVFQEKFLYEYLFLMTASVHVFSLSCIFVFFDPEARAEWVQVFASVCDRKKQGSHLGSVG